MNQSIRLSLIAALVFTPVFFLSCSNQSAAENKNFNRENSLQANHSDQFKSGIAHPEHADQEQSGKKEKQQKLIKTGNLSLLSRHIEKSKNRLDRALRSVGGYYDNEQFSKSDDEYRYSLTLRIPSNQFGRMLELIKNGPDELVSKHIRTADVGGEYKDLEVRINSKRAYLKRYEELLQKANTIDEMIRIQDEIRQLIEEIESQEARLHFLDDQVGYGTLDIELYKTISHPAERSDEPGFWDKAGHALSTGWTGLVVLFLGLLSIWPLLLILIPGGIYIYNRVKRNN